MKRLYPVLAIGLMLLSEACGGGHNTPLAPTSPTPTATTAPPQMPVAPSLGWSETFGGSLSGRWQVSNYGAGVNGSLFTADNVDFSTGMLRIRLNQRVASGVISNGGEVQTVDRYSFGTYTWRARMASTSDTPYGSGSYVSGTTSGLFIYARGSETELDFENEAAYPEWLHLVTWLNGSQVSQSAQIGASVYQSFHDYSVQWTSTSVTYRIDGRTVATETRNVPQVPAYVLMNLWGTNAADWGGMMSTQTRYLYVQSFSYEPK